MHKGVNLIKQSWSVCNFTVDIGNKTLAGLYTCKKKIIWPNVHSRMLNCHHLLSYILCFFVLYSFLFSFRKQYSKHMYVFPIYMMYSHRYAIIDLACTIQYCAREMHVGYYPIIIIRHLVWIGVCKSATEGIWVYKIDVYKTLAVQD